MARYTDTITGRLAADEAFAYLADFSNTAHWDPSVVRAERLDDGPVEVGSRFRVVTRFAGRDVGLEYEITELDAPRRVVLRAGNRTTTSIDTIEVTPDAAGGCVVAYDARLELAGPLKLADPVVHLLFQRLGGHAAEGLRARLAGG